MSEVHRRWQPRGQLLNQRALASGSHAASINARDVRRRSGAGTVRIIRRTQAPSSCRARGTTLTAPSARPGENLIRAATSTDGIGRTLSTVPQGGLVRGATPRWPGAPNPSRVSCPPRSSTDGLGRRARIITPPANFGTPLTRLVPSSQGAPPIIIIMVPTSLQSRVALHPRGNSYPVAAP